MFLMIGNERSFNQSKKMSNMLIFNILGPRIVFIGFIDVYSIHVIITFTEAKKQICNNNLKNVLVKYANNILLKNLQ